MTKIAPPSGLKSLLICDFSWLSHKYFHKLKDLHTEHKGSTVFSGIIYGLCDFVERATRMLPNHDIIFCLESNSNYREDIAENYKKNRPPKDPKLTKCFTDRLQILSLVPHVSFVQAEGFEGDDLMALLSYNAKFRDIPIYKDVMIYTRDRDLLQLMADGIKISNLIKNGKFITVPETYIAESFNNCLPSHLLEYRALVGDSGDGIKPVFKGIYKDFALWFSKKWAENTFTNALISAEDFFNAGHHGLPKKWRPHLDKLIIHQDSAIRNYDLMDLRKYKRDKFQYRRFRERSAHPGELVDKYGLRQYMYFLRKIGVASLTLT